MEQDESQELGERMLVQALRAEGLGLPPEDDAERHTWQQLTRWSGNRSRGELLTDIGLGKKIAAIVAKRLARQLAEQGTRPDAVTLSLGRYIVPDEGALHQNMVQIDGSEGASVKLAACCRPIPGDSIKGYLGRGEGLLIHTAECGIGKRLFERDPEHFMGVEWAEQPVRAFEAGISLLLQNGKGVLARVAAAVAEAEADITHIDMGNDPVAESTELKILVSVRDRLHLADVMRTLKRAQPVMRVSRIKP